MQRILILIHNVQNETTSPDFRKFKNALDQFVDTKHYSVTMGTLRDLVFEVSADNMNIYDPKRGFSLADFDLVVFRIVRKELSRVAACCQFLQVQGIPYIDSYNKPVAISKAAAAFVGRANNIPIIPTLFSNAQQLQEMAQNDQLPFSYPMVIKDQNGKKGRLNFLVHNKKEAIAALTTPDATEFVMQQFIPNEGDYRVLIMGGKIALVIHRKSRSDSYLNNTSQGGTAELVDVSQVDKTMLDDAKRAAALEEIEVAGVDLIIDSKTGKHYIMEVNSSPQLASGAFPERKTKAYVDYLQRRASAKQ
jgi:glutathione synthase/RimK-type ligase-like ATP-grasp enzyme